jgi:diaminopimelate epimerase
VRDPQALAPRVSDRHFGIGGDGLILLLPPENFPGAPQAHVRMRMFNADGSEAEMCGNGVRCVCKLAHDRGVCTANPMRIQTGRGVLTLSYTLDGAGKVAAVTVDMGEPILDPAGIPAALPASFRAARIVDVPLAPHVPIDAGAAWVKGCGLDARMTCVSMGNPHLVLYCARVSAVPLESIGPVLERQPIFPRRINVHFVQVDSRAHVTMRTWERGSGITLACGTGASAVCVAGVLSGRTDRRVTARLPGGELQLEWREADNQVYMTGPATEVFTGAWPEV